MLEDADPQDFCPRLASTPLKLLSTSPSSLPYAIPLGFPFASPAHAAFMPYTASTQMTYNYSSNKPLDFLDAIEASEQACAPDSNASVKFASPKRPVPEYYPISDDGLDDEDMLEEANSFNHNPIQWHTAGHSATPNSEDTARMPNRIYKNIRASLDWLKVRNELSADSGIESIKRSHDDMSRSQEDYLFSPQQNYMERSKQMCLDCQSFDMPRSVSFPSPGTDPPRTQHAAEVNLGWHANKSNEPLVGDCVANFPKPPEEVKWHRATGKIARKVLTPTRSASPIDPSFRGVTLQMQTKFQQNDKVQLSIKAYFNCRKGCRSARKLVNNTSTHVQANDSCSSSDSEGIETLYRERKRRNYIAGKQCASCGTKTTPLWRDAEDGTPLCNACGIRYKKYRIRCSKCWHIPRKDTKMNPSCTNCGETLKLSVMRSKHW